jgi:alpha-D-ribose 1-methylphosphonate 5-triphosphate synthase subunit PhnI
VQHLKLPHYVDFQAELELVRRLRAQHAAQAGETEPATEATQAKSAAEPAQTPQTLQPANGHDHQEQAA